MARTIADELHVNNVAVRHVFRGRGIGSVLLQTSLDEGRKRKAKIAQLEVRVLGEIRSRERVPMEVVERDDLVPIDERARERGRDEPGPARDEDALSLQHGEHCIGCGEGTGTRGSMWNSAPAGMAQTHQASSIQPMHAAAA